MSSAMRSVWLDTDPGFDDWLAMLMLAAHPGLRWLGISVVAGNAPLDVTLDNALRIRHHYGLKVPIHRGSALASVTSSGALPATTLMPSQRSPG